MSTDTLRQMSDAVQYAISAALPVPQEGLRNIATEEMKMSARHALASQIGFTSAVPLLHFVDAIFGDCYPTLLKAEYARRNSGLDITLTEHRQGLLTSAAELVLPAHLSEQSAKSDFFSSNTSEIIAERTALDDVAYRWDDIDNYLEGAGEGGCPALEVPIETMHGEMSLTQYALSRYAVWWTEVAFIPSDVEADQPFI